MYINNLANGYVHILVDPFDEENAFNCVFHYGFSYSFRRAEYGEDR